MRFRSIPLVLAVALLTNACSDDPTGPAADDSLNDTEIEALVEVLISATTFDPEFSDAAFSDAANATTFATRAASQNLVFPVTESSACELGGTITLDGSVTLTLDSEGEGGTYAHEIVQVHDGCTLPSERLGQSFVFDGRPSITSRVSAVLDGTGSVGSFQGSETGTIRWQLGSRSGECTLALQYGIATATPATYQVTGSVCGLAVNEQVVIDE